MTYAAPAVLAEFVKRSPHALTGVLIAGRLFEPKTSNHHVPFFCYSPLDSNSE